MKICLISECDSEGLLLLYQYRNYSTRPVEQGLARSAGRVAERHGVSGRLDLAPCGSIWRFRHSPGRPTRPTVRPGSPWLARSGCPVRPGSPWLARSGCPVRPDSPWLARSGFPVRRGSPWLARSGCPTNAPSTRLAKKIDVQQDVLPRRCLPRLLCIDISCLKSSIE